MSKDLFEPKDIGRISYFDNDFPNGIRDNIKEVEEYIHKEAIEKLQIFISKYKQIEKSNNNDHKVVLTVGYEELEAIDTVLEELNNRIPIKDIEERLNKLKNKQKELDEEGFYGRYKKYGGKQKFEKYYAYINGTIQAYEELLNKE